MRELYYIPTAEEVIREMARAQFFTKLDASSGFWHIMLDQESALLMTFYTRFGHYCFKGLPFGIASAPELFHRTIQQLIKGLPEIRSIHDNIVIWGKDLAEHDRRVTGILEKAREVCLKLNCSKCQYCA